MNQTIGPYTVDFLWRQQRLVVEVDAYGSHSGRQAFEDDRARDLYLHANGYAVLRFSDRQIDRHERVVAHAVRKAVAAS